MPPKSPNKGQETKNYNPFYIEPEKPRNSVSGLLDDDFNDSEDEGLAKEFPIPVNINNQDYRPSKTVKTRARGYSLRTQLLNTSMHNQSIQYLNNVSKINNTTSSDTANNDIELTSVENSYNPDFIHNDEEYERNDKNLRFDTLLTNESIMDLTDEYTHDNFDSKNRKNRIRLSDETQPKRSIFSKIQKKNQFTKKISPGFFKRAFLLLSGGRPELPSVGGRDIPITINISNTDFPVTKNKKNQTLLIDERNNQPYVNNLITSSRYTLVSFLPRQLIAQFSKLANCYFMLVAILQLIPSWSTTGTSTTIIPLSIFISISMLREGYDDIRRHKLDKQENNKKVKVLKEFTAPNSMFESDMRFSKSTTSISRLRPSGQSFDYNFQLENDALDQELENEAIKPNSFQDERLLSGLGISAVKTRWKDLKVGDIVKLNSDDWVPADIAILTSTNEMGEAFIETMALDGETNLKSRIPNVELNNYANKAKNLFNISGTITSEDPNQDLYNFEGSLQFPDFKTQEMKTYPLGPDNIIYRGSIIRNTECCLGVVIFTGEETKIRMNAIKNPRVKAPKLQRKINIIVAFMVFLVISLSLFSFMAERIFYNKYATLNWYINRVNAGTAPTIMGFIIMFNTMIPLSLYVTMEIIKAVQMVLLQWDIDMYHLPTDTPAEARTATILEELGQVSYVFSDKTGTLTDNVMLFRKFSVCGVPWIHDIDLLMKKEEDPHKDDFSDIFSNNEEKPGAIIAPGRPSMASLKSDPKRTFGSPNSVTSPSNPLEIKSSLEFINYIQSNPNTSFAKKSTFFLLSIALCHTCLPRKIEKNEEIRDSVDSLEPATNMNKNDTITEEENEVADVSLNPFDDSTKYTEETDIEYQASSPDELALVQAACDMGFILCDKKQKVVTLKTYPNGFDNQPKFTEYEILDVIEFTSSRKRMSVVVKFPDGKLILLCKGADNIIMERLEEANIVKNKQQELSKTVNNRKKAEAEFILQKRSIDNLSPPNSPRTSLSKLSFTLGRKSSVHYDNINSILDNDTRSETDQIILDSRKSVDIENRKKYNLTQQQYIPPSHLINDDKFLIERTLQHMEEFSSDGLRTLLYSYRELDSTKYEDWSKRYAEAKTSLVNRSEKISEIGKEFENSLKLLGCTAIEDKLQDGVPEAIEKLRRAGIRMWMLTGDKRETAINIGYSCKLIKDYSKVVILSIDKNDESNSDKDDTISSMDPIERLLSVITDTERLINEDSLAHCVVVIDGSTLTEIEKNASVLSSFISLGVKANSVIVCRASPSQKATMVTKVRELDKSKVTLAIGDGANDIAMIQSADVGVGITGKEGLQAARTSDYSIAQFRYLLKLLLVHGRYNYIRTSKFVICTFYKELLFYLSQLLYQRYTLFTGSSLYESWSLSMFNTLFTSLPVLCIGMFDKDLKPSTLIAIPELYSKGVNNETFNLFVFIQWVILATTQSVTLCFILWNIYGFPALVDNTTYPLGVILFTVFIIIINTKLNIFEMHTITKLSIIAWVISVVGWIVWTMLLVGLYRSKINTIFYVQHGLFEEFGRDSTFWASILILTVLGIWIDFLFYFISHLFKITDTEKFQILEKDPKLEKQLELESYNELKQGWTWLHESQIYEAKKNGDLSIGIDIENRGDNEGENDKLKNNIHNFRSFMKKGSIHPSEKTENRKRKGTMVNPTELPPDSPSLVTVSSNDAYTEQMLPSGKIVKIPKFEDSNTNGLSNRTYRNKFNLIGKKHDEEEDGEEEFYHEENEELNSLNIDEILRNRQQTLGDEY